MDLSLPALVLVAIAAAAAGAVNALAGGGTLIVFPALSLAGIPAVEANITATVAQNTGYLGGSFAQRDDLIGQRARVVRLAPVAVAGGLTGAWLLSVTSEELFERIVPWLIFAACGLLAAQPRVRAALERRAGEAAPARPANPGAGVLAATFLPAVYGGYFGAGLGIILLAVLGLVLDDDLRRVNALKQTLSLAVNLSAGFLLLFSGRVWWGAAAVVAVGSLVGGMAGGRLAGHMDPAILRRTVIAIGLVVGTIYLVRSLTA